MKDSTTPYKKAPEDMYRYTFRLPVGLVELFQGMLDECFIKRDAYVNHQLQFELSHLNDRVYSIKARLTSKYTDKRRVALTLDVETAAVLREFCKNFGITRNDLMTDILIDWTDELGKLRALSNMIHQD